MKNYIYSSSPCWEKQNTKKNVMLKHIWLMGNFSQKGNSVFGPSIYLAYLIFIEYIIASCKMIENFIILMCTPLFVWASILGSITERQVQSAVTEWAICPYLYFLYKQRHTHKFYNSFYWHSVPPEACNEGQLVTRLLVFILLLSYVHWTLMFPL